MPSKSHNALADANEKRKHEPDSIWSRTIAALGLSLLLLVVLSLAGIAAAFKAFVPQHVATDAQAASQQQTLAPGVEPNQAYERERLAAEEETFLRQFAWQDKARGIVRIPIERGIELMARKKLKVEWPEKVGVAAPEKPPAEESAP